MTERRLVVAVVAVVVLVVGESVMLWFGWSATGVSPAFTVAFRWSPVVGVALGVTLAVSIVSRSARLARAVGVAEIVRAVVVDALMVLVGAGDDGSGGLAVLSLMWTTTSQAVVAAFLALGVVARQLRVPGQPGRR